MKYLKENSCYTFENLSINNAFFVKPYDFNANLIEKEQLLKEYNDIKKLFNIDTIATVKQEHTSIIKKVTLDNVNDIDVADGMITNIKGIGLATKVADCQAIFLYDQGKKVIGNIHSGWRGTIKHIVKSAIDIMINDYNCDIKNIKVFINPSIGQCHFEVDLDVYIEFKNEFKKFNIDSYTIKKNNKYYIDTEMLNRDYLIKLGVLKENIEISEICTVCNGNIIHSYRYDKDNSGRNLAIISFVYL